MRNRLIMVAPAWALLALSFQRSRARGPLTNRMNATKLRTELHGPAAGFARFCAHS
jgi:hypothetical protein